MHLNRNTVYKDHFAFSNVHYNLPLIVTCAVCEYVVTGSPGVWMLALHVYVHVPAVGAYNERRLVLSELSMPVVVMFELTPLWFRVSITSEGDVCIQLIVFDVVTVSGWVTLQSIKIVL